MMQINSHLLCLHHMVAWFWPYLYKMFTSSTLGFSFRINKFEWNKFDDCVFVSLLIKVLRYCIGGLICFVWLYGELQICSACFACPIYSVGAFGVCFSCDSQGAEESYLTVMLAKFIAQIDLVKKNKRD